MMTASGCSVLTFRAATSASWASVTTWSAFPFSLNPTANCIQTPPILAPLQRPCEFSCSRDSARSLPFSRRVELFEIGDDIVNLLRILQTWKSHLGTRYLGLRILDVFAESGFIPGDSGILVRGRIAVAFNHPRLSPEQPVEHWANCVLCALTDLVTGLALDENLFTRSRVLGIPRDDREDSGSEHENETAHPTDSMADKEHTRANRSDHFANRLRNDSIVQKDLLARPDLKSPICEHDACGHNRPPSRTKRWHLRR